MRGVRGPRRLRESRHSASRVPRAFASGHGAHSIH
nr:MAG TPA_asm: hypothetical protein [Caudoviricetes sp.]